MEAEKTNNVNIYGAKLSGKHAKNLVKIFESGLMVPEFYESLFKKFDANEKNILDIKREFETDCKKRHNCSCDSITYDEKISVVNSMFAQTLVHYPSRGIKRISRIMDMSETLITTLLDNEYSDYDSFIVFGCPESTDIDVVCFVRKQDVIYRQPLIRPDTGTVKDLSSIAQNRLMLELAAIGYGKQYNLSKDIDVNSVYVDPETKMIVALSKGWKETQNIINTTWIHHRQIMVNNDLPLALSLHPMCNIIFTRSDVNDKLKSFAKFVIDFAEDTFINYDDTIRQMKHDIYAITDICYNSMIKVMTHLINLIVYEPDVVDSRKMNSIKWHDRFKSIIMKLIQLSLFWKNNQTVYVKMELAESVRTIFYGIAEQTVLDSYVEGARWYLFRGHKGLFCKELFPALLNEHNRIANELCNF